jgi:hypothetical protein
MKSNRLLFVFIFMLLGALLLDSCRSMPRVGELQSESQSIELGDAKSVLVKINMGAGNLVVAGGTEQLLDADFNYNVARLKPEVNYADDTLVLGQPDAEGLPNLRGITDFRNDWNLQLNNDVPMDLRVNMGAGTSELHLADLALTGLAITLGAGQSTVDLNGNWTRDLDVTVDTGATDITVQLPQNVGVRVEVERGPTAIDASGLTQDGDIYTNAAYGESPVTLDVNVKAGVGLLNLEVVDDQ